MHDSLTDLVVVVSRLIWKTLPVPNALRRIASSVFIRWFLWVSLRSRGPRSVAVITSGPLIVSGYLRSNNGIGNAARLTAKMLGAAFPNLVRHDLQSLLNAPPYVNTPPIASAPGGVWILHCNAPEAAVALARASRQDCERYRIGYWAWELPRLPKSWQSVAPLFHEIWTPSQFVANAVAPFARVVRVMPHPLDLTPPGVRSLSRFGFRQNTFNFATLADAHSSFDRKNPMGAVIAYIHAFPRPCENANLTVKIANSHVDPEGITRLKALIEGREDIRIYCEDLSDEEMRNFMTCTDALISLHRSEGFGLAIAESLVLGHPVICTGWSGNVDYMVGLAEAMMVDYDLVEVNDETGRYIGEKWAEPNLFAAAVKIREVVFSPAIRALMADVASATRAKLCDPWQRSLLAEFSMTQFIEPAMSSRYER